MDLPDQRPGSEDERARQGFLGLARHAEQAMIDLLDHPLARTYLAPDQVETFSAARREANLLRAQIVVNNPAEL